MAPIPHPRVPWRHCLPLIAILVAAGCPEGRTPGPAASTGPGGIHVGMAREAVLHAMLAEVQALQMVGLVRNPYGREMRVAPDGTVFEVLFYYTGMKRGDNQVTDDELVPVILVNGLVAAWGREQLDRWSGGRKAP